MKTIFKEIKENIFTKIEISVKIVFCKRENVWPAHWNFLFFCQKEKKWSKIEISAKNCKYFVKNLQKLKYLLKVIIFEL